MNAHDALIKLAESTADAVPTTLGMYGVVDVLVSRPVVVDDHTNPFASLPAPGLATSVAYEGGVTGGNLLGLSHKGARMLASAMMGQDASAIPPEGELSELDMSAVSEAMNQIMAAAAAATGAVLETEIEIGPPETKTYTTAAEAVEAFAGTPASHVVITGLTVLGEPARLVQLVPNAFVVRMTRALDELAAEVADDGRTGPPAVAGGEADAISGAMLDTTLRVWAEVGRAKLPVGRVVSLPAGSVLELDRLAEDPVDIFVNGHRYATGRLVVDDGGEWAVRLESILPRTPMTLQEVC